MANLAVSPEGHSGKIPDLDALYSCLTEADETGNADALAALAWELYGLLGPLVADRDALRARLRQIVAATATARAGACRA